MMVRFCQPFLLGGLVYVWKDIVSSPVYLSLFCLAAAAIGGYVAYTYYLAQRRRSFQAKASLISPNKQVADQLDDFEEDGLIEVIDIVTKGPSFALKLKPIELSTQSQEAETKDEEKSHFKNHLSSDPASAVTSISFSHAMVPSLEVQSVTETVVNDCHAGQKKLADVSAISCSEEVCSTGEHSLSEMSFIISDSTSYDDCDSEEEKESFI
jgi:hypothetical protein